MKEDRKVQVGIIGCGSISQWRHLPVLVGEMQEEMEVKYEKLGDNPVKVMAICDPDEDRLTQVRERYNITLAYAHYEELLKNQEIDAVVIATPNEEKPKITIAAAEAKKHIFLEKPMASTLVEAQRMAKIIKQNNIKFQIGFNKRYYYGYRIAKQQIDEGKIGAVQGLCVRLWIPLPDLETFSKDVGIHMYDLLYFFVGPVAEVYANPVKMKGEFTIGVNLRFENNAVGLLFLSSNAEFWYSNERVEIIGDKGSGLIIDNGQRVYKTSKQGPSLYWEPSLSVHWQTGNEIAGYARELKYFINCITSNQISEVGVESGLHSLQLHEAILESAEKGVPVALSSKERRSS